LPVRRQALLDELPKLQLTLVIGQYAQRWHLPKSGKNLTETVRAWRKYGDGVIPLPHPSPRNNIWMKKNPWFAEELLPALRLPVKRCRIYFLHGLSQAHHHPRAPHLSRAHQ